MCKILKDRKVNILTCLTNSCRLSYSLRLQAIIRSLDLIATTFPPMIASLAAQEIINSSHDLTHPLPLVRAKESLKCAQTNKSTSMHKTLITYALILQHKLTSCANFQNECTFFIPPLVIVTLCHN